MLTDKSFEDSDNVTHMLPLERKVHTCRDCKDRESLRQILKYPPVYSFGDPSGKDIIVVGQNPSYKEFETQKGFKRPFLSNDGNVANRRESQLNYFDQRHGHPYRFFRKIEQFFGGEVKNQMKWDKSPWEKVGYLDLVKCPTRVKDGQWTRVKPAQKKKLIENCEDYLKKQLEIYKPKIIIPYGNDVGKWFKNWLKVDKEFNELVWEGTSAPLGSREIQLLFIAQRQGSHSKPEVYWIKKRIMKLIEQSKESS